MTNNDTEFDAWMRKAIAYDSQTGLFTWLPRGVDMFKSTPTGIAQRVCANWNARNSGRVAGTKDSHGYVQIKLRGRLYLAHRLAWRLVHGECSEEIDHIDGDRSNNRIGNLRVATRAQNCANRRVRSDSISKIKGVQRRPNGLWQSRLCVNGTKHYLGVFGSRGEAIDAYERAARTHFKEFAKARETIDPDEFEI
jgi:hypothetical protein